MLSIVDTFDLEIQLRPCTKHQNADNLSRFQIKCKNLNCPCCDFENKKSVFALSQLSNGLEDGSKELDWYQSNYPFHSKELDCKQSNHPFHIFPVIDPNISEDLDNHFHATDCSNWLKNLTKDEIRKMQSNDPIIRPFIEYKVISQNKPNKSEMKGFSRDTKILFSQWDILELNDNILYRNNYRQNCLQLVSHVDIQNDIFENFHVKKIAGHFGIERTVSSIKRRFYWPRMDECMKRCCESCDMCARCKLGPGVGNSPIQQFKVGAPLQCIALDIVVPLPETKNGNLYI